MNLSRHNSSKAVALVVTLLLLSVITFLAVAFLALSRRDRQSVSLSLTQSETRYLADAATARAQAEIFAHVSVTSNLLGAPLMVSRNYQNPAGFDPNQSLPPGGDGFLNVNWDYKINGNTNYTEPERLRLLTNLFYDPRLPVFVQTNANAARPRDFRFFVDLNRSGRFDTNGRTATLDGLGNKVGTNFLVGDPEWIGVLSQPQFPHSGTNRAVGRYAYVVVPTGLTLDLNHIHNNAKANMVGYGSSLPSDGFFRNQGVGSYELNLAGFLRELNTNYYRPISYSYSAATNSPAANTGRAFQDASALLSRRLGTNANGQLTVANLFNGSATLPFINSDIDLLAKGASMSAGDENRPWAGSPSPNVFDDIQELLDPNKTTPAFVRDLVDMGTNTSTYDRYSFYRLLAQMGVASTPAVQGKVNLNYTNDITRNAVGESFNDRTGLSFFLAAADTLLTNTFLRGQPTDVLTNGYDARAFIPRGFSITNIPVYPTNYYNAAVHRTLQLAANLFEATRTNRYPTVFRPLFVRNGNTLRISGYTNEETANFLTTTIRPVDLQTLTTNLGISDVRNTIAYGQPMVIGARKYLPNLNEVGLLSLINAQRKLELVKDQPRELVPSRTNQMFILGITNQFAVETWYPYTNNYQPAGNQIEILGWYQPNVTLRNPLWDQSTDNAILGVGGAPYNQLAASYRILTNLGSGWQAGRFVVPVVTNTFVLPNSVFKAGKNQFSPIDPDLVKTNDFEQVGLKASEFQITVNTRLQLAIVDRTANRVLDYVSLDGLGFTTNVLQMLQTSPDYSEFWNTNASIGIAKQLRIALGDEDLPIGTPEPKVTGILEQKDKAIDRVRVFLGKTPFRYSPSDFQATPELKVWFDLGESLSLVSSYSANDPLVHYTRKDLMNSKRDNPVRKEGAISIRSNSPPDLTIGAINGGGRYAPWGDPRSPGSQLALNQGGQTDPLATDLRFRDPLVRQPDDWDFPTNKFSGLGQMGRVHRGTPWQTIYFKAFTNWTAASNLWTGISGSGLGHPHETLPANDWKLPDYFTTLPSEASAKGLLSVNQTNIAAWAAGLAGVLALTNTATTPNQFTPPDNFAPWVITPATPQFRTIMAGINRIQNSHLNTNGTIQMFSSVGQILETPELTTESPYLNLSGNQRQFGVNDAAYEWIPRQILSLLKVGEPRYLVYAYGQSLRPADNSIVFTPPYQNLATNYQITGEMVTRSLIRLDGNPTNPVVVVEKFDILPSE